MKIEPIILDKEFNEIAVIDDYISLIWTTRYYLCGDFEICIDVSKANKELFQKDYYIKREDDDNIGIIESIEVKTDEDNHETAIISGRFLSSVLSRRIIAVQTQLNGPVGSGIYNLISDNVINPVINERKIDNFICGNMDIKERIEAQYTGKNLLETVEAICESYHIGFKTVIDENNNMKFYLYKGIDRSYNQEENPHVIFSDEYDNLLSSLYKEEYQGMKTDILVAGEGEGLERRTLWVSPESKKGLERYEFYQDQRNISSNGENISDEEYMNQLKEEGLETITSFTTAFEGQVYFDNLVYKKDVFLGDICTIQNNQWGIYINSRLVEVIESIDESGNYTINPTFGI